MNKFHKRYNDYKKTIPIKDIGIAYSNSHGRVTKSINSIGVFIFSSTFFIDIKRERGILPEAGSIIVLDLDLYAGDIGAVRIVPGCVNGTQFAAQSIIKYPVELAAYANKLRVAIDLSESEQAKAFEVDGARLWIYANIHKPIYFTISKFEVVECLKHPKAYHFDDFIVNNNAVSWHDGLRPLIDAGWTDLHFMAHWGHADLVRQLLREGVSPNIQERNGGTALHRVADTDRVDIARDLLEAGANPNLVDTDLMETPLDCALRKGHSRVADLLVEYGAIGKSELGMLSSSA